MTENDKLFAYIKYYVTGTSITRKKVIDMIVLMLLILCCFNYSVRLDHGKLLTATFLLMKIRKLITARPCLLEVFPGH